MASGEGAPNGAEMGGSIFPRFEVGVPMPAGTALPAAEPHHGSVRHFAGHGRRGEDGIGVTLAGTEHVMSLEDALGLANAIILTAVDKRQRNMRDKEWMSDGR